MDPSVNAVATAPVTFSRNGDEATSAAEPEEEDTDLCGKSIGQYYDNDMEILVKNSTVAERAAVLRALLTKCAERNADLANIVSDAAR